MIEEFQTENMAMFTRIFEHLDLMKGASSVHGTEPDFQSTFDPICDPDSNFMIDLPASTASELKNLNDICTVNANIKKAMENKLHTVHYSTKEDIIRHLMQAIGSDICWNGFSWRGTEQKISFADDVYEIYNMMIKKATKLFPGVEISYFDTRIKSHLRHTPQRIERTEMKKTKGNAEKTQVQLNKRNNTNFFSKT